MHFTLFNIHERYKYVTIFILLFICCLETYSFHQIFKAGTVFTHFFYVPIILATIWWERRGLWSAVFLAALLLSSHVVYRPDVISINDYLRATMFFVIGFTVAFLSENISKERGQVLHLNKVLSAIRNVNQLIVKEWEGDKLLKDICNSIIETRGFYNAWIAITNDVKNYVISSEITQGEFKPKTDMIEKGKMPQCAQRALSQDGVVFIKNPRKECSDCPLHNMYGDRGTMVVSLKHGKTIYGLMGISVPVNFISHEEEQSLFLEVADDVAYALHDRDLRKDKVRAEEKIKEINKNLEKRVKDRTTELEIANNDLKDFAYIVSHDLKAPLRAIGQLSNWIKEDYSSSLDEDGIEKLDLVFSRVKRMESLIDGILKYSRVGRIQVKNEEVNLNFLIGDIITDIAPGDAITITIKNELPMIMCDRTKIRQVFQNLIVNAVTFMDKNRGEIEIGLDDENSCWKFSITDNGPGIDKKYHEKIFQIFQTLEARDKRESTGIGLTLVKKIIELNGGEIWVKSESGRGSTFFFTLPKDGNER